MRSHVFSFLAAIVIAGCSEQQSVVVAEPAELTGDAIGHYCQMIVLDHAGPKAQVHLAGQSEPLWFTQIRDAMAFARMPEETAEIAAIFVSDMGAAEGWQSPGTDNWIDARVAHYVMGSNRRGGMGAPELVPFSSPEEANIFAGRHGGTVIGYDAITDAMVLSPVEVDGQPPDGGGHHTEPTSPHQHGTEVQG
ncbi:MAG TPA: nitrous oxide reductase accessory protein NosL [Afifellaceae bacterium]|nr:nitrous oxide reductase accessory protein NosL [Afifellaceae bacterium]